ncbi:recombinase family protein [Nonomuraea sp. NPDC050328]|uniref:recombinase family protein n=1 Tax=Nonomuraea sp. NPDC050328 TaxID=3364361 RepID=UPI0037AD438A
MSESRTGALAAAGLIPAIGYIRVSMMLEEKISPAIQRDSIESYAARRGYYIPPGMWPEGGWIEDLDVSGRTFQRKIMDAIAQVEKGTARAILVWKYSRFGRNRTGNQLNLARVEAAGGELISSTEEVDARTAVGKLTRGVLMEIAAFESDRAGESWADAYQNRVARGLPPYGRAYFGYIRRGRMPHPLSPTHTLRDPSDGEERYEPDMESGAAEMHAELYETWVVDQNFASLARELNRRGFRTSGGLLWSAETVVQLMDRGFAAGLIRIHDPECACRRPSRCSRRVFRPGAHEALISPELWAKYLALRAGKVIRRVRSVHHYVSFISCWHCGGGMHLRQGSASFYCGSRARHDEEVCGSRHVPLRAVDEAVLSVLRDWAPEIEAAAAAASVEPVRREKDVRRLTKELERVAGELDRQTLLLTRGLIPEDSYLRTRDDLLAEQAQFRESLRQLEADAEEARISPRAARQVMDGLVAEWPSLGVLERRSLLMQVIERVAVEKPSYEQAWLWIYPTFEGEAKRVRLGGKAQLERVIEVVVQALTDGGGRSFGAGELRALAGASSPTFTRAMRDLVSMGVVAREGTPPITRYVLLKPMPAQPTLDAVKTEIVRALVEMRGETLGARELRVRVGATLPTFGRAVMVLAAEGVLAREGKGKLSRYRLATQASRIAGQKRL